MLLFLKSFIYIICLRKNRNKMSIIFRRKPSLCSILPLGDLSIHLSLGKSVNGSGVTQSRVAPCHLDFSMDLHAALRAPCQLAAGPQFISTDGALKPARERCSARDFSLLESFWQISSFFSSHRSLSS